MKKLGVHDAEYWRQRGIIPPDDPIFDDVEIEEYAGPINIRVTNYYIGNDWYPARLPEGDLNYVDPKTKESIPPWWDRHKMPFRVPDGAGCGGWLLVAQALFPCHNCSGLMLVGGLWVYEQTSRAFKIQIEPVRYTYEIGELVKSFYQVCKGDPERHLVPCGYNCYS